MAVFQVCAQCGRESDLMKWEKWISEDLYTQMETFVMIQETVKGWQALVKESPPNSEARNLNVYIHLTYFLSLASALRRVCDQHKQSRSLNRLLHSMKEDASILTRHWWEERGKTLLCEQSWTDDQHSSYLAFFGELSNGGNHIAAAVIASDITQLNESYEKIRNHLNKFIFHIDAERSEDLHLAGIGDFNNTAERALVIFYRWYFVLTATVPPAYPVHGWEGLFTSDWLDQEHASKLTEQRISNAQRRRQQRIETATSSKNVDRKPIVIEKMLDE